MKKPIELYGTQSCQYCAAAREDFEWRGIEFVEYDFWIQAYFGGHRYDTDN